MEDIAFVFGGLAPTYDDIVETELRGRCHLVILLLWLNDFDMLDRVEGEA